MIMCKCPNTIVWTGEYCQTSHKYKELIDDPFDKLLKLPSDYVTKYEFGDYRPKFKFIGKIPYKDLVDNYSAWIQVPCGQCLECRIQQTRTWADRIILESKNYKYNYFVTLTYDDDHLPVNGSLDKKDLQKFIHKVRDIFRNRFHYAGIRFFGCGEYGDITRRCHFHLVLFNCPLNDLSYDFYEAKDGRFYHMPNRSDGLLYSRLIHEAWDYKGNISVGKVTYDSAAYVAGYVTKKYKPGMKEFYSNLGIEPEFCSMSTHPGIGADYFHKDDSIMNLDHIIIPAPGEAHLSVIPRYYDKLFIKKYGLNIFDRTIREERINNRLSRLGDNRRNGIDKDYLGERKDYKLVNSQKLRNKI